MSDKIHPSSPIQQLAERHASYSHIFKTIADVLVDSPIEDAHFVIAACNHAAAGDNIATIKKSPKRPGKKVSR